MDLHAARREVRRAAAETESCVPTSRSSNKSTSTGHAQKGAKTDPKPFVTENANVVHQHHHAWVDMASMCARQTRPTRVFFLQIALLNSHLIRNEQRSDDRAGGANDTSNVAGSVGIISDAIERLRD